MQKIVNEDIDILRGRQSDGTYLYASYIADEAGRSEKGFTVPAGEELVQLSVKGEASYAVLLRLPSRRYLVRRNQQVYVDRVDMEITPSVGGRRVDARLPGHHAVGAGEHGRRRHRQRTVAAGPAAGHVAAGPRGRPRRTRGRELEDEHSRRAARGARRRGLVGARPGKPAVAPSVFHGSATM